MILLAEIPLRREFLTVQANGKGGKRHNGNNCPSEKKEIFHL
jgi:hypothetical protein